MGFCSFVRSSRAVRSTGRHGVLGNGDAPASHYPCLPIESEPLTALDLALGGCGLLCLLQLSCLALALDGDLAGAEVRESLGAQTLVLGLGDLLALGQLRQSGLRRFIHLLLL